MKKVSRILLGLIIAVLFITGCGIRFTAPQTAKAATQLKAPKVKSKKATKDTITIKWKKVSGAAGYSLYMYDEAKKQYTVYKTSTKTSCKVIGLENGKTYKFKISAYSEANGTKTEGKLSKVIKVKTKKANAQNTVTLNAPDFTVYDETGKKFNLSDYAGTPIIINVWATWCGPCVYELPSYQNMYDKYGQKVQFMIINIEDKYDIENVKSFVNSNDFTFPVFYDWDSSALIAYGTGYIPITIAINSQGDITYNSVGSLEESELEGIIKELLG